MHATGVIDKRRYVVAVRELCEFTAKQGDLDLRFTPAPSAQEGIAGHVEVASRRGTGYQAEVSLAGDYQHLHVRGRADGYDAAINRLEEVKTFRGSLDRQPANHRHLHWAQVKIYGWLLCEKLGLTEIDLALVYFDIGSRKETVLTELHSAQALQKFFEEQCERFLAWAMQELRHRNLRDRALEALPFPYAEFRAGQRELAEAVYRANTNGRCLMAQAPTGIGKTIGTLFPLLKATPKQELDKVFFLAAKTSGRGMALDAVSRIRECAPTLPLRTLELVARDKACEHPDKACHGESCPLAKGFYDHLPQARTAALEAASAGAMLDRQSVRAVALAHDVCPYYLSQDLARWADVIVGDYNYYFDLGAMLYGLTATNQWRVSILVDEAHNMIERTRKMYTAELDQRAFRMARKTAPPALKKPLDKLARQWKKLFCSQEEAYQVHDEVPDAFLLSLQQASTAITDYVSDTAAAGDPAVLDTPLQQFHFDALHFTQLAELFGSHSLFDVTLNGGVDTMLCLRNVVPAPFLKERFDAARSTTLFSATLSPWNFVADTLGLSEDAAWIDVQSPFCAEQLSVNISGNISTRYRDREESLQPIVGLMEKQYVERPGNYLAFFSSFEYMQKLADLVAKQLPDIPIWVQSRGMEEAAKEAFLARFESTGRGIGFAVLGGAFAEGIDLPGERLIGAFIATLGLPQVNPVNEQIKQRMDATFGAGYDYTYLYPGIQKVVQAAGRVIRTPEDRGVIHLIDDRFTQARIRRLFPAWWRVESAC
jgi:DNA excision repair protein ERCC-2